MKELLNDEIYMRDTDIDSSEDNIEESQKDA